MTIFTTKSKAQKQNASSERSLPLRFVLLSLFLAITCLLCTCESAQQNTSNTTVASASEPVKETVMESLRRPWSMKFLSEEEALLNEKDGDLLRINLTSGSRSTIAGIPQDLADSLRIDTTLYPPINAFPGAHGTNQKYNAGLFDLALDPGFATNRWLYISYAAQESERGYALRV
ncbi:MAG: PQQ-dependent sugar dehydrogenase, partial [Bacteroidota bacterium]